MTIEKIILGLSLIISGLAIIIGIISLYQVKINYPNSLINWYKNIFLFLTWGLFFILNYGLLKHNNWAKNGLIFLFEMIFIFLSVFILFNLLSYLLLLLKKDYSLDNQINDKNINKEILPTNNHLFDPEDLDQINYNSPIVWEKKDLDELNINDDEENNDEIYYLDNLTEENGKFFDDSSNFSFESSLESYTKQGLLINIIMAFLANVIIFYWIDALENLPVK